jgi:hypothetical protein
VIFLFLSHQVFGSGFRFLSLSASSIHWVLVAVLFLSTQKFSNGMQEGSAYKKEFDQANQNRQNVLKRHYFVADFGIAPGGI